MRHMRVTLAAITLATLAAAAGGAMA